MMGKYRISATIDAGQSPEETPFLTARRVVEEVILIQGYSCVLTSTCSLDAIYTILQASRYANPSKAQCTLS